MSKTPIIGILETGRPPEHLAPEHGNYPSMVRDWLDMPEAEYKSFAALDGQLPDSPRAAELWVITGSRFGVYDGDQWIAALDPSSTPASASIQAAEQRPPTGVPCLRECRMRFRTSGETWSCMWRPDKTNS